jgi:hypothetical protein
MPLLTELGNFLGCDFYKYVAPERGLVCCRLAARPHAAPTGVIFSGQNFCRAQSQNCETKTPNACAARQTGGPNILGNTMPNLTIRQIAEEINKRASTHAIGEPPLDSECRAYIKRLRRDLSVPISYRQIQIVKS